MAHLGLVAAETLHGRGTVHVQLALHEMVSGTYRGFFLASIVAVAAIYISINLSIIGVVSWREFVPADAPVDVQLPTTASAAPGGGAIVPVSGVSWVPYAADRPFHGQVMQMDASPVPLLAPPPTLPVLDGVEPLPAPPSL